MKKVLRFLVLLVFLVIAYLVVLDLYPKNAGRFPFLALLLLGDIYLWNSIKQWISGRKGIFKIPANYLVLAPFFTAHRGHCILPVTTR